MLRTWIRFSAILQIPRACALGYRMSRLRRFWQRLSAGRISLIPAPPHKLYSHSGGGHTRPVILHSAAFLVADSHPPSWPTLQACDITFRSRRSGRLQARTRLDHGDQSSIVYSERAKLNLGLALLADSHPPIQRTVPDKVTDSNPPIRLEYLESYTKLCLQGLCLLAYLG